MKGRDDVTAVAFTLYELITNDTQFTNIPHWDRNLDMVPNVSEWTCNRELDSDISKFRNFLNDSVATRNLKGDMERYLNAPNKLTWPDLPTPSDYNVPFEIGKTSSGEPVWATGPRFRRTAMEKGQYCFLWERPPQIKFVAQGQQWHTLAEIQSISLNCRIFIRFESEDEFHSPSQQLPFVAKPP